jgi:hypothetical protein
MAEFLKFCEVVAENHLGRECLSSPWTLQSLLAKSKFGQDYTLSSQQQE